MATTYAEDVVKLCFFDHVARLRLVLSKVGGVDGWQVGGEGGLSELEPEVEGLQVSLVSRTIRKEVKTKRHRRDRCG